jgi:hypothetical protein
MNDKGGSQKDTAPVSATKQITSGGKDERKGRKTNDGNG